MSLAAKKISLQFQLGQGSFGDSGFDVITVEGLRASATISKSGGVSMATLSLKVYGMSLSVMNQLSTLGKPLVDGRNNIVTVQAGDDETGMAVVFIGIISEAWVDPSNMPQVAFMVQAHTGLLDALKPAPPRSYPGAADVATIMSGLAQQMGYGFENSGVQVTLSNPYFPGTARQQMEACARAANINAYVDNNVLAIWPADSSRGGLIPLISAATGLVGYPMHTQNGIALRTVFNRSITFGGRVVVESDLKPACGTWTVFSVVHELESETYGGQWFTTLECSVLGREPPLG